MYITDLFYFALLLWFGWNVRAGRHTDLGGVILAPALFSIDFASVYFHYKTHFPGLSWKLGAVSLALGAAGFLYAYYYGRDEATIVSTKSSNIEATRVDVKPEPIVGDFIITITLFLFCLRLAIAFKQNLIDRGVPAGAFAWISNVYLFAYFLVWPPMVGYFIGQSFLAYQAVREARAHHKIARR